MDIGGVLLTVAGLVVLLVIALVVLATPLLLIAAVAEPLRRPRRTGAPQRPVRALEPVDDDGMDGRRRSR